MLGIGEISFLEKELKPKVPFLELFSNPHDQRLPDSFHYTGSHSLSFFTAWLFAPESISTI
jgi:hypothetical protein